MSRQKSANVGRCAIQVDDQHVRALQIAMKDVLCMQVLDPLQHKVQTTRMRRMPTMCWMRSDSTAQNQIGLGKVRVYCESATIMQR